MLQQCWQEAFRCQAICSKYLATPLCMPCKARGAPRAAAQNAAGPALAFTEHQQELLKGNEELFSRAELARTLDTNAQ